ETLTPGSRHAFALLSQARGVSFQHRADTGGVSEEAARVSGTAPRYVRLTRRGSTIAAYVRTAATSWQALGTATIPMGTTVYVGVAVTSHDAAQRATAAFAGITLRRP